MTSLRDGLLLHGFPHASELDEVVAYLISHDFMFLEDLIGAPSLGNDPHMFMISTAAFEFLDDLVCKLTRAQATALTICKKTSAKSSVCVRPRAEHVVASASVPSSQCVGGAPNKDEATLTSLRDAVKKSSSVVVDNKGVGPQQALKRLKIAISDNDARVAWIHSARLNAIFGGAARSQASFFSGLRCYFDFAHSVPHIAGRELPPSAD